MNDVRLIRHALISVSNKSGIVKFAKSLIDNSINIISTDGTARYLREHGVLVTEVSNYSGFPEIMDGRIKTLHHKIFAGILGRRGQDDHEMKVHNITPIDIVIVNFYPFEQAISEGNCTSSEILENIDIGGPTMVRAAAKNHEDIAVVVNPNEYDCIIDEIDSSDGYLSSGTRIRLAASAFEYTANYESTISSYFNEKSLISKGKQKRSRNCKFPMVFSKSFKKKQTLLYGENSHQTAALYAEENFLDPSVLTASQIQGKALSYNNIIDTNAALECIKEFNEPACVIIKHTNPCAVALGKTIFEAYDNAYRADPVSAFGGIIAFNRILDPLTSSAIIEKQFSEVIIAPSILDESIKILNKKKNIRLLQCSGIQSNRIYGFDIKSIKGGIIIQDYDQAMISENQIKVVSKRQPEKKELKDSLFCWKVVKYVKSNAIVYSRNCVTVGIGAGQMSRVYSAKIAKMKATELGLKLKGCVMASDAFFPFRDGIDEAARVGISCIIQPGGSIRDKEIIKAADQHGISMIFTGIRHFLH
ncbi:bifunctional purine biosynthesis protein [Candidatus Photodesmus katoptron]|uniref:Bifunctional purine biosynthesis protein PurH n=1 Tax=Candidatus Photodesmus katoptron Akat1 TaxID=1236703 RepID=S3DGK1_9GAMM|nr:bifunctional phosphoribosylaminoimidazolecarboxamide formyltransferase/IMP cyclohydrolase [Candidatus Photodesmus katoptron]EPE37582.1 bifunctional purine biosynthesis protein PurH [Candidatus Photodesmus katoptron Akat1]KEY90701.1 bifunctional purine biosynthesis protein [Candidatus Photodesmus katoptron]